MSTHLALYSESEIRLFQLKLAEKPLAHYYCNRSCFTETVSIQLSAYSIGIGAVLWELAEKSSAWLLRDQAVSLELTGIRPEGCLSYKLFEIFDCLSYLS